MPKKIKKRVPKVRVAKKTPAKKGKAVKAKKPEKDKAPHWYKVVISRERAIVEELSVAVKAYSSQEARDAAEQISEDLADSNDWNEADWDLRYGWAEVVSDLGTTDERNKEELCDEEVDLT